MTLVDGIHYITCERVGCNQLVGARRFEDGQCVEEEYVPEARMVDNKYYCCLECANRSEDFITPDDWQDGELEEAD